MGAQVHLMGALIYIYTVYIMIRNESTIYPLGLSLEHCTLQLHAVQSKQLDLQTREIHRIWHGNNGPHL